MFNGYFLAILVTYQLHEVTKIKAILMKFKEKLPVMAKSRRLIIGYDPVTLLSGIHLRNVCKRHVQRY